MQALAIKQEESAKRLPGQVRVYAEHGSYWILQDLLPKQSAQCTTYFTCGFRWKMLSLYCYTDYRYLFMFTVVCIRRYVKICM